MGSTNPNVPLRTPFPDLDDYVITVKRFNATHGIEIGHCGGVIRLNANMFVLHPTS